jgi:hypothetical protein
MARNPAVNLQRNRFTRNSNFANAGTISCISTIQTTIRNKHWRRHA